MDNKLELLQAIADKKVYAYHYFEDKLMPIACNVPVTVSQESNAILLRFGNRYKYIYPHTRVEFVEGSVEIGEAPTIRLYATENWSKYTPAKVS